MYSIRFNEYDIHGFKRAPRLYRTLDKALKAAAIFIEKEFTENSGVAWSDFSLIDSEGREVFHHSYDNRRSRRECLINGISFYPDEQYFFFNRRKMEYAPFMKKKTFQFVCMYPTILECLQYLTKYYKERY